jgi:methylmalonyl-CoA mutase
LLGDRIRMNAAFYDNVFMRSMATRRSHLATNESLLQALQVLRDSDFDVIFVETSGIGQADSEIVDIADYSMYVMTSEYGASTQLEKIDMLDFADIIVINKFERRGSEDALRDVRRQYRRNRQLGNEVRDEDLPVFGTIASQYGDAGVDALFADLCQRTGLARHRHKAMAKLRCSTPHARMIPEDRQNYLGEIVRTIRDYQRQGEEQVNLVRDWESLTRAAEISKLPELETLAGERQAALQPLTRDILDNYSRVAAGMQQEVYTYHVRGREFSAPTAHESLAGSRISRVALPRFHSQAERLRFLWRENLPGFFPIQPVFFRSSEAMRSRAGNLPVKAPRRARISAFTTSAAMIRPNASVSLSIQSHSTVKIPTKGPIFSEKSERVGFLSARLQTCNNFLPVLICLTPIPRCL